MQLHRAWSLWRRIPRVALILGMLLASALAFSLALWVAGHSVAASPKSKNAQPFTITSPDFTEDGPLPQSSAFNRFGCGGKNIAPTLNWQGAPAGTASFALEVTDYDAPVAGGFHHWIVYNIPANVQTLNGSSPYSQGTNSFGFVGYGGPCPPATGQIHHYIFTLYALTTSQVAGQALTYDQLIRAISGQVVGATVTIGTFVRS